MRLITVFWLICIFPYVAFSIEGYDDYLIEAKQQVALSNFKEAALLYERCVYLSDNPNDQARFLIEKAKCYWNVNEFEGALHSLRRIKPYAVSDSMLFETQLALVTTHHLLGDFISAQSELIQIKAFTPDTHLVHKADFLSGLNNVQLREWEKAKQDFMSWSAYYSPTDSIRKLRENYISCLFDKDNLPKYKNPETARRWSTFLPGTGQLYAGYFWEGAASLSFQLLGLAVIGYGIYSTYYITGGVVGFGIFQRFYSGGVNRAEFLAEKKNYHNLEELEGKLKKLR